MGRPKKWPPTILPHRSSGLDRVRVDGDDIYLGPIGSEESRAAYARLLARVAAGLPAREEKPDAGLTVADVVAEWFSQEAPRYTARGGEKKQFRCAVKPLLRLFGPTPASAFRRPQLEQVQAAMIAGTWLTPGEIAAHQKARKPVRWAASYANRQIVRVRTIWRWAEGKDYVPEGRYEHLRSLPGIAANDARARHTEERRGITREELDAVLAHVPTPAVRAMLLLQWFTGMRPGEVRTMRPGLIDRSGDVWVYRPPEHKGDWRGHGRQVVFGPNAQAVLAPFLVGCLPDAYVFRPSASRRHGHYTKDAYYRAVERAAGLAGLPDVTPYRIRHSAKRRAVAAMGLDAARAFLGQKCLSTTDGYDDARDLALAEQVARQIG